MDTCSINNRRIKVLASFKYGAFAFLFEKARLVRSVVICICVTKGGAIQMTTVEDLYYGNISPHERYIKRGTRVDKLVKLICKNEEEFNSGLTEKPKEIFNKFTDRQKELSDITTRQVFADGFSLAVQIIVEVMSRTETEEEM